MAPRYKIDSTKRVVLETMKSPSFSVQERFAYLLGARSMAKILAGEDSGVARLLQKYMDEGVHLHDT